jgi:hypothetical protein
VRRSKCERSRFFTYVGLRGGDGRLAGWGDGLGGWEDGVAGWEDGVAGWEDGLAVRDERLARLSGTDGLAKPRVAADRRATVDVHGHLEPARAKLAERS